MAAADAVLALASFAAAPLAFVSASLVALDAFPFKTFLFFLSAALESDNAFLAALSSLASLVSAALAFLAAATKVAYFFFMPS